jgi:hypothetical protein
VSHLSTRAQIAALPREAEFGVAELADRQLGLVTRHQLLKLGWSPARVSANTAGWRTVLPGVLLTRGFEVSPLVLAQAGILARPDGCLSYLAAARMRGWEVLDTRPNGRRLSFPSANGLDRTAST